LSLHQQLANYLTQHYYTTTSLHSTLRTQHTTRKAEKRTRTLIGITTEDPIQSTGTHFTNPRQLFFILGTTPHGNSVQSPKTHILHINYNLHITRAHALHTIRLNRDLSFPEI